MQEVDRSGNGVRSDGKVLEPRPKTRLMAFITGMFLFLSVISSLLLEGSGVLDAADGHWVTTRRFLGFSAAECLICVPLLIALLLSLVTLAVRAREEPREPGPR